jgi:hypothetical protein
MEEIHKLSSAQHPRSRNLNQDNIEDEHHRHGNFHNIIFN